MKDLIVLSIFLLIGAYALYQKPCSVKLKLSVLFAGKGFGSSSGGIPKPNIIKASLGSTNKDLEKFLMMYTCKICSGRNANMVSKVAYYEGMVVATCRHCKNKHWIADNQKKLDFPAQFGNKIDEYLEANGEKVQRMSITTAELENNYLIDTDGVLTLFPKEAGQVNYYFLRYTYLS